MAPRTASQVLIARRYLERGFLDTAMRLMVRNAASVEAGDWAFLVERLMERGRIVDVVQVCALGGVELPREQLLAIGDTRLRARDFDGAKLLYEIADADTPRWEHFVDVLTSLPGQERLALQLAERHLVSLARAS
ncbi:MAG: hypothetical protein KIT14_05600 [bacterium]|nr:hypothetical protein [bacterium]